MRDQLDEVTAELRAFVAERDWEQFHDPKNLAMALSSEAGELLAHFRWVDGAQADRLAQADRYGDAIAQEAADVGIILLLFCDRVGIDLIETMRRKIAANRERYPADEVRGRWERPSSDSVPGTNY